MIAVCICRLRKVHARTSCDACSDRIQPNKLEDYFIITAEKTLNLFDMRYYPEKCHSDEAIMETLLVERGKPCERATQIWWGRLDLRK